MEEVSSKAESMDVEQKKKAASKHTNGKDEQPDTRMEKKQLLFCKLSDALQFQFAELPPKHFRRNPKTVIIIRSMYAATGCRVHTLSSICSPPFSIYSSTGVFQ